MKAHTPPFLAAAALVAILSSPLTAALPPATADAVELPETATISVTANPGDQIDIITHDVVAFGPGSGYGPGSGTGPGSGPGYGIGPGYGAGPGSRPNPTFRPGPGYRPNPGYRPAPGSHPGPNPRRPVRRG